MLIKVTRETRGYTVKTIDNTYRLPTDIDRYKQLVVGESTLGYIAEADLLGLVLLLNDM